MLGFSRKITTFASGIEEYGQEDSFVSMGNMLFRSGCKRCETQVRAGD